MHYKGGPSQYIKSAIKRRMSSDEFTERRMSTNTKKRARKCLHSTYMDPSAGFVRFRCLHGCHTSTLSFPRTWTHRITFSPNPAQRLSPSPREPRISSQALWSRSILPWPVSISISALVALQRRPGLSWSVRSASLSISWSCSVDALQFPFPVLVVRRGNSARLRMQKNSIRAPLPGSLCSVHLLGFGRRRAACEPNAPILYYTLPC